MPCVACRPFGSPGLPVKSRRSWLAIVAVLLALGGCTVYYGFVHDWRGRFTPGQLALEAQVVAGRELNVVLRNTGTVSLMVYDSPELAGPYELSITPTAGGEPVRHTPGPAAPSGGSMVLRSAAPDNVCSRSVPLARIFPRAAPGRYTLRVAYDPAAAAARNDPCAADLTLGRVEAVPLEIALPADR